MNETVLRVIQALEIKDTFRCVLNQDNIDELQQLGYQVNILAELEHFLLFECEISNYVSLGDVCRRQLGQQAQYGTRYADPDWSEDYTYCGTGLRIRLNESKNYHKYTIHRNDVQMFVDRVKVSRGY